MHGWLFEQQAEFTDDELTAALAEMNVPDVEEFLSVMQGKEVLERIEADVIEADRVGISGTPMIFVNGVQLVGWEAEQGIERAVAAIDGIDPPARTAAVDHPVDGLTRRLARWSEQDVEQRLPAEPARWTRGPEDAAVRIVLFFDYRNPYAPELWQSVEAARRKRPDVRVDLYLFPISKRLNPQFAEMEEERYPLAGPAARLAEAAGQTGGQEAFWRMQHWIIENRDTFSLDAGLQASDIGAFAVRRRPKSWSRLA